MATTSQQTKLWDGCMSCGMEFKRGEKTCGSCPPPQKTPCPWCGTDEATLIVVSTPACVLCAESPKVRVRRWLQQVGTRAERMEMR